MKKSFQSTIFKIDINLLISLKRHIEKQEKDWNEIEESVMENYRTQIQEFEEAIMSIEEQKMGIYEKLNEAARAHNEVF